MGMAFPIMLKNNKKMNCSVINFFLVFDFDLHEMGSYHLHEMGNGAECAITCIYCNLC